MFEIKQNVLIDYFKIVFTLPEYNTGYGLNDIPDFEILVALLGYQVSDLQYHKKGLGNFKVHISLGEFIDLGIEGPVNKTNDVTHLLEMKGEACREFESRNGSWEHLIKFCFNNGWKFARIDIANDIIVDDPDEEPYLFDLDKLIYHYQTNQFAVNGFNESRIVLGKNNSDGKRLGTSITFGSMNSECELQIYDKKEERKARNQGNTDVNSLYVWAVSWTRIEMRLKQGKADSFVEELLKLGFDQLPKVYSMALKGMLNFKHRPGNVPKELWLKHYPDKQQRKSKTNTKRQRWLTCEWWDKHLGNVEGIKLQSQYDLEKTILKSKRWREKSVSRSLTTYAMAEPENFYNHIADMLEKGLERQTEKELVQIEKYREDQNTDDVDENDMKNELYNIIEKLRKLGELND